MPKVQFVETDMATSFATQIDLVDYENNLFLTKQLRGRIYKEVFRISGEIIRENFKETLTQNWFWVSNEELIKLLKQYKAIPNNTVTQASLLQAVQNMSKKMLRSNISPFMEVK